MEFLAIAKDILGFVSTVDFTGVVLLVFLVVFIWMLYRLSKSESSKFFYDQLFVDKDGVASTSKIAHLIVLTVSTWGFVHLTLKGELSEWYFLAYITIWVAQRGFTKWVDMQQAQGGTAYHMPPQQPYGYQQGPYQPGYTAYGETQYVPPSDPYMNKGQFDNPDGPN
jgi:hypothetical protein